MGKTRQPYADAASERVYQENKNTRAVEKAIIRKLYLRLLALPLDKLAPAAVACGRTVVPSYVPTRTARDEYARWLAANSPVQALSLLAHWEAK